VLPRHIRVGSAGVTGALDNGSGRVIWWAFRETSGSATAAFRLWDSSTNAGALLLPVGLNASESVSDSSGPFGIPYRVGLYLEVLSGAFEGTIQVIDLHEHRLTCLPAIVVGEVNLDLGSGRAPG
jgi:hypothetical protein